MTDVMETIAKKRRRLNALRKRQREFFERNGHNSIAIVEEIYGLERTINALSSLSSPPSKVSSHSSY